MEAISFERAVFIFAQNYRKQRHGKIAKLLFQIGEETHSTDHRKDGGPGSGNFGHEGRPGEIGGSGGGNHFVEAMSPASAIASYQNYGYQEVNNSHRKEEELTGRAMVLSWIAPNGNADNAEEVYRVDLGRDLLSIKDLTFMFGTKVKIYSFEINIDFTSGHATIKLRGNTDGGSGSGNFGHKGIPGQLGGSAPSPSAKGDNLKPIGFEHKKTAAWKLKKHGEGYIGFSLEQFEKRACDLLEKACEGDIDG